MLEGLQQCFYTWLIRAAICGGPVPVSTFMVPRILLCTGAVLGDGVPRFASAFTTFCKTHVKQTPHFTQISREHQPRTCLVAACILYQYTSSNLNVHP